MANSLVREERPLGSQRVPFWQCQIDRIWSQKLIYIHIISLNQNHLSDSVSVLLAHRRIIHMCMLVNWHLPMVEILQSNCNCKQIWIWSLAFLEFQVTSYNRSLHPNDSVEFGLPHAEAGACLFPPSPSYCHVIALSHRVTATVSVWATCGPVGSWGPHLVLLSIAFIRTLVKNLPVATTRLTNFSRSYHQAQSPNSCIWKGKKHVYSNLHIIFLY